MEPWTLDSEIENLRYLFVDAKSGDAQWKDVWDKVAEIRDGFRSVRYASRDERDRAWKCFQSILSDMEEQRRELAKSSHGVRVNIEDLLENARSFDPDDALTNILGAMIPVAQIGFVLDPVVTRQREILQVRSKFLKNAWEMFRTNRMTTEDRNAVYADLRETQSILNREWEQWKSTEAQHKEERLADRRQRIESNIDRNLERIAKLQSVLENKEGHLSRFEANRDNARTEEFRIAMEEKIESISEQIEDIRRKIEELERYVEEDREKL